MTKKRPALPSFEKVISPANSCLVLEEVIGPRLSCIYHYHPEYELTYIGEGYGHVLIGSVIEPFAPGHLALIGPNIPHYYASTEISKSKSHAISHVIKFQRDCFGQSFFDLKEMAILKHLLEQAQNGIALLPEDGKQFDNRIISLFQASAPLQVVKFLELLCEIASTRQHLLLTTPFSTPPDDVDTERINRALVYINRHLGEKITVAQVSRVTGLSSVVFSRIFSRIVRKTFSQYVLELRLDKACRLLTETTQSILEIAYESGFQNLSNFNRLFRKYRHITPREFRNLSRPAIAKKIMTPPQSDFPHHRQ